MALASLGPAFFAVCIAALGIRGAGVWLWGTVQGASRRWCHFAPIPMVKGLHGFPSRQCWLLFL